MSDVILCNISDANEIIEEARHEWINDVFDALNIPDEIFDVDTIDDYRMNMEEIGVEVVLYATGEVDVFKKVWCEAGDLSDWLPPTKDHLVAQWKTPERVIRMDKEKKMYCEVHLNEWSIKNTGL